MSGFFLYAYIVAFGFVASGICASSARLMTGRALGFAVDPTFGPATAILGVFVRVLAGPAILMRNSILGALSDGRPVFWLALSTMIATIWSFLSGVLLVGIIFGFTGNI
jgi:hypothetical protein